MTVPSPSFVLETALYADDLEGAGWFYGNVLGLEVLFREEGRHVFFRCGTGVVLLFRAEATRQSDKVPPHGTEGDGHVAFAVEADRLDEWQTHFADYGIEVELDKDWGEWGRSLYVRDPAGNSVELATPTLWGTASRDDWLRQIRPRSARDVNEMEPIERFQEETLRPLIEELDDSLLRVVAGHLDQEEGAFASMARPDQLDRLRRGIEEETALRQTLLGMVVGHLTADELSTYLTHRATVRRRCVSLIVARMQARIEEIVDRLSPSSST